MKSNHVTKYNPPTRYDNMPYGTLWSNIGEDSGVSRYIQLSEDESSPNWQILGIFLETSLTKALEEQKFIDMCLESYKKHMQ